MVKVRRFSGQCANLIFRFSFEFSVTLVGAGFFTWFIVGVAQLRYRILLDLEKGLFEVCEVRHDFIDFWF